MNSWRPTLRARIEPKDSGSSLRGRIGVHPFVIVFTSAYLGFAGLISLIGLIGGIVPMALIPAGMCLFALALTGMGRYSARDEGPALLDTIRTAIEGEVIPP